LSRLKLFVALAVVVLLVGPQVATADITAVNLGTAAPPTTLGPYTMTPFPLDPRPLFGTVTNVPSPLGGAVGFSDTREHVRVGSGWATWSHGYTGDVYFSPSLATSLTLTLPPNTGAFDFWAEPDPFATFTITAVANDGTTLSESVSGIGGASGFGFFASAGTSITSIAISSAADFGIGEFGIAASVSGVPEPTTIALFGVGLCGLLGYAGRRRKRTA
jgi:hypothetical protein